MTTTDRASAAVSDSWARDVRADSAPDTGRSPLLASPTTADRLAAGATTAERLLAQHTPWGETSGATPAPGEPADSPDPGPPDPGPPDLGPLGGAALGTQLPLPANVLSGSGGVQAEIAANILENVAAGRPPFRPDLGTVGPVSWFVTEGTPYTGVADGAITLPVDVSIPRGAEVLEFREQDLLSLYERALPDARALAEAQRRADLGIGATEELSNRVLRGIERHASRIAERAMWTDVGTQVARSPSGIGRVILEDSRFSRQGNGVFTLTGEASNISIRGGPAALLDIVRANGVRAEPQVVEAAEQLARQGQIAGRLEGVFRVGGRVMIVAGLASDGYRIYTADDHVRETARVVGGWAGAAGTMAAYNAVTGASNAAGPWAWAANAVGNLVAGGVGYFAGEKIVEVVYDLVIDGDPITVPAGR